jgi:hypothetical protein
MRRFWSKNVIFLGGLIVMGIMTSCSTALMKTSPFYTGSMIAGKTSSGQIVRWDDPKSVKIEKVFAHKLETQMDNDRIYIWPLFYKNFLMYSILWPLAEINDVGWDIRPFVSVDNYAGEYRILTGGWNSKKDSNYIFPLYVKTKDKFISLPFSTVKDGEYSSYNFMLMAGYFSRDNSSYFAPLYYYNGTKGQLYSLICSFAKDNGYILPLYFYNSKEKAGKLTSKHIILPFGYLKYITEKEQTKCERAMFLPLFVYKQNPVTVYIDNPKYRGKKFTYKNRPKDFYLEKQSVQKNLWITPTIFINSNKEKEQQSTVIFPLFFAGNDEDSGWLTVFPLYFSGYGKDNAWRALFPLYFAGYDEDETWMTLFPLCFSGSGKDKAWLTIFPFYFSGYDKIADEEWFSIFPFYTSSRNQKNSYKNYSVIAGTRDEEILDKSYHSSYILPLYNYSYSKISKCMVDPKYKGQDIEYNKRPKDYWKQEQTVEKSSYYFPNIFTSSYENKQAESTTYFPFYFNGYEKMLDADREWFSIFPLYTYNRNKQKISKNYGVFTGTKKQVINNKTYNSSYAIPFYSYGYQNIYHSIVNPKYKKSKFNYNNRPKDYYIRKDTVAQNSYIFPTTFTTKYENNQYSNFVTFPFYFSGYDKRWSGDTEWQTIFPLYFYNRDNKNISRNYLGFSGTSEKEINNKMYKSSYVLPFYSAWYTQKTECKINNKYSGKQLKYNKRPKDYYAVKPTVTKKSFIFPSIYMSHNSERQEDYFTFFPFIFHEKNERLDSWGSLLWFYTSRNHLLKGERETQALWYLYYNYQRTADKATKRVAYESSRVLWKGYHRETKGENTNVDIFPFISYSQNQQRTKLSFAYHFFSVNKNKTATKIHLLFIPVWW